MTTRLLVGDVFDRMAQLEDGSFDLIVTSPPFLALRSYLPDGHPDKAKEIGSEATPADYLDTLLALTAEWRRLLAPHGSIAVELGDTYAGSGGAGGDYLNAGLRDGQPAFDGSSARNRAIERAATYDGGASDRHDFAKPGTRSRLSAGEGWPLDKSLTGIPTLYSWSLAYGRNLLTGAESPAGRWRIRNLKPWIRSNPPVGALGDKERPATSYITVACVGGARWFDLDAVRTGSDYDRSNLRGNGARAADAQVPGQRHNASDHTTNPGGAPPLDWWHHVDAIIDHALTVLEKPQNGQPENLFGYDPKAPDQRATKGTHLRRALEKAGILTTLDAYDVSPRGYQGAHYAVWPPELVRLMIDEMCPRRVCTQCGVPSRRIVATKRIAEADDRQRRKNANGQRPGPGCQDRAPEVGWEMDRQTLGWSDCGHGNWRPGRVLDPFVGSGTTLAVASGMGRDSVGIDLDERSVDLARERVGMFLEVEYPEREVPA